MHSPLESIIPTRLQCWAALQEQTEVGFEAVGLSSTPWEVARSFAAMLQLANARKLNICRHADLQPGAA